VKVVGRKNKGIMAAARNTQKNENVKFKETACKRESSIFERGKQKQTE
jgi:hypothetical protein